MPVTTVNGSLRAVSSVVEHLVYTERVGGSKPSPPSSILQRRDLGSANLVLLWFPEFDSVSFWIHNPGEFAVVVTFHPGIDLDALTLQLRQEFIQILDLQVDHERLCARREVIGVIRKWRPDGVSLRVWIVRFSPFEYRTVLLFTFDTEVQRDTNYAACLDRLL